jgi:hypothetical protein
VPLKVTVFAWRLLRERLPTKDNLLRCSILHHDNQLCVGGCGMEETTYNLFFSCPILDTIWYQLRGWSGVSRVDPMFLFEHFLQFDQLGGNHTDAFCRFFFNLTSKN